MTASTRYVGNLCKGHKIKTKYQGKFLKLGLTTNLQRTWITKKGYQEKFHNSGLATNLQRIQNHNKNYKFSINNVRSNHRIITIDYLYTLSFNLQQFYFFNRNSIIYMFNQVYITKNSNQSHLTPGRDM